MARITQPMRPSVSAVPSGSPTLLNPSRALVSSRRPRAALPPSKAAAPRLDSASATPHGVVILTELAKALPPGPRGPRHVAAHGSSDAQSMEQLRHVQRVALLLGDDESLLGKSQRVPLAGTERDARQVAECPRAAPRVVDNTEPVACLREIVARLSEVPPHHGVESTRGQRHARARARLLRGSLERGGTPLGDEGMVPLRLGEHRERGGCPRPGRQVIACVRSGKAFLKQNPPLRDRTMFQPKGPQ